MTDSIDKAVDNIPTLADRTVLAVLRRAPLKTARKYDEVTQRQVQQELGDESAEVKTHLFRDKTNPVRRILTLDGQAYTAHRRITLPWIDAGPRLLVGSMIDRYKSMMNDFKTEINTMREQEILPNWDALVAKDIQFRQQAAYAESDPVKRQQKLDRISGSEYPNVEQVASRFTLEWRIRPVGTDDTRCQLPEYAKEQLRADLQAEIDDAVVLVKQDIGKRMMDRIDTALTSLSKQKADGSFATFNDNTIESIRETLDLIADLNVTGDANVDAAIERAIVIVHGDMAGPSAIRASDDARHKTVSQLNELKDMFGGLGGGQ